MDWWEDQDILTILRVHWEQNDVVLEDQELGSNNDRKQPPLLEKVYWPLSNRSKLLDRLIHLIHHCQKQIPQHHGRHAKFPILYIEKRKIVRILIGYSG